MFNLSFDIQSQLYLFHSLWLLLALACLASPPGRPPEHPVCPPGGAEHVVGDLQCGHPDAILDGIANPVIISEEGIIICITYQI